MNTANTTTTRRRSDSFRARPASAPTRRGERRTTSKSVSPATWPETVRASTGPRRTAAASQPRAETIAVAHNMTTIHW